MRKGLSLSTENMRESERGARTRIVCMAVVRSGA